MLSRTLLRTVRFSSGIAIRRAALPSAFHGHIPSLVTYGRFQSTSKSTTAQVKVDKPELMIAFTCKKCDTRSSHTMSKQAYTSGTVLITCPGCKNRHLIADHLKIFSDNRITIEDILKAKGESVSQSTDDLIFDEIPEKLKPLIGHHAKDSPNKPAEGETDTAPEILPSSESKRETN